MELLRVTTGVKLRNLERPGTKQRQEEGKLLHFCFAQQIKMNYVKLALTFPKQTSEVKLSHFIALLSDGVCSHRWPEKETDRFYLEPNPNIMNPRTFDSERMACLGWIGVMRITSGSCVFSGCSLSVIVH